MVDKGGFGRSLVGFESFLVGVFNFDYMCDIING